jgi:hypothetical protein
MQLHTHKCGCIVCLHNRCSLISLVVSGPEICCYATGRLFLSFCNTVWTAVATLITLSWLCLLRFQETEALIRLLGYLRLLRTSENINVDLRDSRSATSYPSVRLFFLVTEISRSVEEIVECIMIPIPISLFLSIFKLFRSLSQLNVLN